MSAPVAAVPATCCGREGGCVCAKEATCSCGKKSALHCDCEKASAENVVAGARCSCSESALPSNPSSPVRSHTDLLNGWFHVDQRPAGECTCSRAGAENAKPAAGSTCACGKRSSDSCTCGGTEAGVSSELETDFTTKTPRA
nr:hypothetical protein CFP56_21846 [Quercus suber]